MLPFAEVRSNDPEAFSRLQGPSDVFRYMLCDLLMRGLDRIPASFDVPTDRLRLLVAQIQELPYELSWTQVSRRFADIGLTARLECQLLAGKFCLTLVVLRGRNPVWTKVIFIGSPDPVRWHYVFKDIELQGNKLVVTRRVGMSDVNGVLNYEFYALPIDEISA
ncbi:hypothetical protein RNZ50_01080 [Paracoccaceae bacterium Fryx2]|nr:hypothetical protein [Paracoccaceae bacterium Fryx2]